MVQPTLCFTNSVSKVCNDFEESWKEIDTHLGKFYNIVKIDCKVNNHACWNDFGIRKWPMFLLFSNGYGTKVCSLLFIQLVEKYTGQRGVAEIGNWALMTYPEKVKFVPGEYVADLPERKVTKDPSQAAIH